MALPPQPRPWTWAIQALALASAYFAAGKLALLLTVPPDHLAVIWPPAGFALVGILLLGARFWPAVWLGSFAVHASMGLDAASAGTTATSLALAAGVATGAALQAVAGAWLMRRFVCWPAPLIRQRKILGFMAFGGPIASVIGASWTVGTMLLAGTISLEGAGMRWCTDWAGSTFGVWIFAPLALIAFGQPREIWRRRWRSVAIPLAAGFAVSVSVCCFVQKDEAARRENVFARKAQEQTNRLALAVRASEATLAGLASFFEASTEVNREEFRIYAGRALQLHPGIEALSWVPRIPAAGRAAAEESAWRDGLEDFRITEMIDGQLVPAAAREAYFPVFYLAPHGGFSAVLGFDLGSHPLRLAGLSRARDAGVLQATAPIQLVQGTGIGFLLMTPVYESSVEDLHGQREERPGGRELVSLRRVRFRGVVCEAFQIQKLLRHALDESFSGDADLRIDDVTDAPAPALVFLSRPGMLRPASEAGDWSTDLAIAGRTWRLQFFPTAAYLANQHSILAWAVAAGAFFLTSLLGCVLLLITGGTMWMELAIKERTADLRKVNADLETQAAERERIAGQLRQSESLLRSFFDSSPLIMGMVELLDDDVLHISANAAAAQLFEKTPAELLMRRARDCRSPREGVALGLARFREAQQKRRPVEFEYRRETSQGLRHLVATVTYICDSPEGAPRCCYVLQDVTERKRAEETQKRLVSILEATSDLVAMIDMSGRVLYLNRAGRDLLGVTGENEELALNLRQMHPPAALDTVQHESFPVAMLEGSWSGESALLHRSGREISVSQVVISHKDEHGRIQFLSTIIRDMSEQKETEQQIRASLAEKEVLLKEVHHRVKNNMQIVSSLLQLQAGYIKDPQAAGMFEESCNRIRSLALIHEKLYQSRSLAEIDFGDYVRSLVSMAFAAHRHSHVETSVEVDALNLALDTAIPVGLIINELVTNSLRFAFAGRERGLLRVQLRATEAGRYELLVRDDGIGLPKGFNPAKASTLGLRLVRILATQIHGEIAYTNGTGSEFRLLFSDVARS